jgi:hypothetical protein
MLVLNSFRVALTVGGVNRPVLLPAFAERASGVAVARRAWGLSLATVCVAASSLALGGMPALAAPGAPLIEGESVSNVAGSSATLQGQIDPDGEATTYRFDYGPSASYGMSAPAPEGEVPTSGLNGVSIGVHLQDLQPDTTYHYRLVATNPHGAGDGADRIFTTQPVGAEFALPDGRQYELVSPPDKHGAEALAMDSYSGGGVVQAAEDGHAITYLTNEPPELQPPANADAIQLLSTRGPEGWGTQDLATPHDEPTGPSIGYGTEYGGFSTDLSRAVVAPLGDMPLSAEAPSGWPALYLRDGEGGYAPLFTKVPAGTGEEGLKAQFVTATPDFSHLVFTANPPLTEKAQAAIFWPNVYEWDAGVLKLINILPDGEATAGEAGVGQISNGGDPRHAISNDGSHVIWAYQSSGSSFYFVGCCRWLVVFGEPIAGGVQR